MGITVSLCHVSLAWDNIEHSIVCICLLPPPLLSEACSRRGSRSRVSESHDKSPARRNYGGSHRTCCWNSSWNWSKWVTVVNYQFLMLPFLISLLLVLQSGTWWQPCLYQMPSYRSVSTDWNRCGYLIYVEPSHPLSWSFEPWLRDSNWFGAIRLDLSVINSKAMGHHLLLWVWRRRRTKQVLRESSSQTPRGLREKLGEVAGSGWPRRLRFSFP